MTKKGAGLLLAMSAFALPLAACGGDPAEGENAAGINNDAAALEPGSETLAAALDGDVGTTGDLAKAAGLGTVLDGVGPYTVFAPRDAAFDAWGSDKVGELKGDGMRAQAASLVTAHIVPGLVTTADLQKAIDAGKGGSAMMTTMAGGTLTFSREGNAILVKTEGGQTARLAGDEMLASNGAVHPIDSLLVPTDGGATAPAAGQ